MISRRTFLQQAGAFAPAALVVPLSQPRRRYKLGLQLYTMRAALARDVEGTLKRIAGMGYEQVETYGFDPRGIGYYGLPGKAFAQRLRENNLTTPSGHYDLNRFVSTSVGDLERYVDRCIEGAHALGQAYITWPLLDEDSRTIEKFKFTRIWPDASLSGLKHFFVEQGGNFTHDPFRSVADSAEYVKRVLLK